MNALIYYDYGIESINGSLTNIIEYFLCIYEHNKDFKLLLINSNKSNKQFYVNMIKERYILDDISDFENNIIVISKYKLLYQKFNKVLIHSTGTVKQIRGLVNAKQIFIISDYWEEKPEYFFRKDLYNVTYFGEMPFQYKDKQYTFKMLFDRYKPLPYEEDNIYIHSPQNKDRSFIDEIDLPDKPMIFREEGHRPNFFRDYKIFVYYHANKWFDPSPRLMHESFFYGKKILYFNKYNIKDGSMYRYNDLLKNGLLNRVLTKNDDIVQRLI